jgi:hypothetical protein
MMPLVQLWFALVQLRVYNTILTTINTINHMSKSNSKTNTTRRVARFYTLRDNNGREVQIDLNNYRCICNITHKRVTFHHEYLNGLICRKYQGNIDLFRDTYMTTQAAARQKRARDIQRRIDQLNTQLQGLINQREQLANHTTLC